MSARPQSEKWTLKRRLRLRLSHWTGGRVQYRTEGRSGISTLGHRDYVGGNWDEMGRLQFDFLVSKGLLPESVFLDIACGSLRAGVHLIKYLEPGHYLGIDQEQALIDTGIAKELGHDVAEEKLPEFVISSRFEFDRFSKRSDYSLAQSLFTHLTPPDIELCLANLRGAVDTGHQFFATFGNGENDENPDRSHAHKGFWYSPDELASLGAQHSWESDYIGEWGHPDGQEMMQFTAIAQP